MNDSNQLSAPPTWLMRVSVLTARIGGALIFLMAFPITIDVVTRKLFNIAFLESYEISTYIFAVAVPLGYGYALFAGAHIRIDVVFARLRGLQRAALDILGMVLLTGVVTVFSWQAARTAYESFRMGARSNSTLGTPLAMPQSLWAAGLCFFALICLVVTFRITYLTLRGRYDEADNLTNGKTIGPLEQRDAGEDCS